VATAPPWGRLAGRGNPKTDDAFVQFLQGAVGLPPSAMRAHVPAVPR